MFTNKIKVAISYAMCAAILLAPTKSYSSSPGGLGVKTVNVGAVSVENNTGAFVNGELYMLGSKPALLGLGLEAQQVSDTSIINAHIGALFANISSLGNSLFKLRAGIGNKGAVLNGTYEYTLPAKSIKQTLSFYIGYQKYNKAHDYLSGYKVGIGYYY